MWYIVKFLILINFIIISNVSIAQDTLDIDKQFSDYLEKKFALQTLQIYQFMDRFNYDEKIKIDKLRSSKKTNIYILLNQNDSTLLNSEVTHNFINLLGSDSIKFKLSYNYKDWNANVKTIFNYKKKEILINIVMKFIKDKFGYKWTIDTVKSDFFAQPKINYSVYINPLNNEVNFSELSSILENNKSIWSYTENKQYNSLSSFQDYIKNGDLVFDRIENIQYQFNNVLGYNFTVDYYMRTDMNAGWLISSLSKTIQNENK